MKVASHETIQSIVSISHLRMTSLGVYRLPELADHITPYSCDTADAVHLKQETLFNPSRFFVTSLSGMHQDALVCTLLKICELPQQMGYINVS